MVALFTVEITERISWHAPQYGLRTYYVNPAYTSRLVELLARMPSFCYRELLHVDL